MKAYQQEYLQLLRSVTTASGPSADDLGPEAFIQAARQASLARQQAVARGTQLLREELFPVLDNILTCSEQELASLLEFSGSLMNITAQKDVGLHYRIHLALMDRARQLKDRDTLIRELYLVGMSLYNMENMLSPNHVRLYTARLRMYFTEGASYYDTEYDQITDPETRGYIHRCMGNIALGYISNDPKTSMIKLAAITRSINILSDPDVRAKTPSLPWDVYLFKSHQERTTLLSFLRSGQAEPEVFTQVLESAQIVQEQQLASFREKGGSPPTRWQYAYMAARYHCGAMLLPDMLDGLYGLSAACDDSDTSFQSMFSHASVPAYFFEYAKGMDKGGYTQTLITRGGRMTRRLFRWLVHMPQDDDNEQLMAFLRQFLYFYQELPGLMPFFDVLQNVFAACHPTAYVRMWIAGQTARQLALWAAEDCPAQLVGMPGFAAVEDVIWKRDALGDFACQAGRLFDAGMVHFFNLENVACRGLFEEEDALLQLHAYCGAQLLSRYTSTAVFADVALGHHRHYDEKGGYPLDFSFHDRPMRPMIHIAAAADLLSSDQETASRYRPAVPFDQACGQLREGAGTRYAPFVSALLDSPQRREQLRGQLERWKSEAYLDMYRRREEMLSG